MSSNDRRGGKSPRKFASGQKRNKTGEGPSATSQNADKGAWAKRSSKRASQYSENSSNKNFEGRNGPKGGFKKRRTSPGESDSQFNSKGSWGKSKSEEFPRRNFSGESQQRTRDRRQFSYENKSFDRPEEKFVFERLHNVFIDLTLQKKGNGIT